LNILVNLNGRLINEKKAVVSVDNRSFRYGDGCFETIKVINGKINLLDFHLDRLFSAMQSLAFEVPSFFTPAFVSRSVIDLLKANGHQELARVRLTIFAGSGGLYDDISRNLHYLIQSWTLNDANNEPNENGLVIGTYLNGFKAADGFSNIKNNNFLLYAMAALHAKKQQWNDALILNHEGNICDSTIANVFIISGNKIVTPRLSDGPVNGTMRRYLLEKLSTIDYEISETSITPEMVENAEECFFSNAIYGIKWVKQYGETQFANQHFYIIYREIIRPLWKG